MQPDLPTLRRLALIRYQHQIGVQQAKLPEPLSSIGILTLHDAVESFLVLAAECLDVVPPQFEKYWDVLSKSLPHGANLAGAEAGKRLNRLRVLIKHHGGIASSANIEQAVLDVSSFMAANCEILFGIDYGAISLAHVIPERSVRQMVMAADEAASTEDYKGAMVNLVNAFDALFKPHRWRRPGQWGRPESPFHFGPDIKISSESWPSGASTSAALRRLAEEHAAITVAVGEMQAAMRMTALGIEFSAYQRFKSLTPQFHDIFRGNDPTFTRVFQSSPAYAPTRDHYDFCQQFIVTAALRLAEAESHIEKVPWQLTKMRDGKVVRPGRPIVIAEISMRLHGSDDTSE